MNREALPKNGKWMLRRTNGHVPDHSIGGGRGRSVNSLAPNLQSLTVDGVWEPVGSLEDPKLFDTKEMAMAHHG